MAVNLDEIWHDQTHQSFSHDFCSLTGNKYCTLAPFCQRKASRAVNTFSWKRWVYGSSLAWPPMPSQGFVSSTRWLQPTHCIVGFCILIYSLLLAQRWKPFPHRSIRKVLSLFQFCYLLSGMAGWLTALGIDSVPFARREWCFLSKEVTSGCASLLNSSKCSCYAQGREVHLVLAVWVKEGLVLFL